MCFRSRIIVAATAIAASTKSLFLRFGVWIWFHFGLVACNKSTKCYFLMAAPPPLLPWSAWAPTIYINSFGWNDTVLGNRMGGTQCCLASHCPRWDVNVSLLVWASRFILFHFFLFDVNQCEYTPGSVLHTRVVHNTHIDTSSMINSIVMKINLQNRSARTYTWRTESNMHEAIL